MSKILIDEAVAKDTLYALEALARGNPTFESIGYGLVAVDDLRQALADAALDKMAENARELGLDYEQPAQQEPVAWLFQHEETGLTECVDTQQVKRGFEKNNPRWQKVAPLYTTPPAPAQPWVGLTNEEIYEAGHLKVEGERMLPFSFARAIEAKLKEKNHG